MERQITRKQQVFVDEYLKDLNATQAAIRAGYSAKTADKIGPELLGKTSIAAAIETAMARRARRTEITQDRVLEEVARLAYSDVRNLFDEQGRLLPIHKLPPEVTASISSIKIKTHTIPGTDPVEVEHITEVKLWDKPKNIELAGKHLGSWNEVGSKENPMIHVSRIELVPLD